MIVKTIELIIITLAFGAFGELCAADTQPGKNPRVGVLLSSGPDSSPYLLDFRQGLRERGWMEGQNITLEYRYAEEDYKRLPSLASELVQLPVDVLFASTAPATKVARDATTTIPIVFEMMADPVSAGFIKGLAQPGENLTGVAGFLPEISAKCLELLKEVMPDITHVAVLVNPDHPNTFARLQETERAARNLGVQLDILEVRDLGTLNDAFTEMASKEVNALLLMADPILSSYNKRIADFAIAYRLPSASELTELAEAGGLLAYGVSLPALWRRAAHYVDRILKGARPANLPVERPAEFQLVINLETAQILNLAIPPSILIRANKVIQ